MVVRGGETKRHGSYDLAVLGGGSAAFAAALRGSELGARVLLVNAGAIGGTCVNTGCVPSKTLIRAAENVHWNELSRFRGIKPEASRVDFPELVREKDELVASLRQARYLDVAGRRSADRGACGAGAASGPARDRLGRRDPSGRQDRHRDRRAAGAASDRGPGRVGGLGQHPCPRCLRASPGAHRPGRFTSRSG